MCGRYVSVQTDHDLTREFEVEEVVGDEPAPSWNVAPTDAVRIVVRRRPHGSDDDAAPVRQLRTVTWGLVPSWSKSRTGGAKMINARSETVAVKPAFKTAAGKRRCLVPALGYYEWQTSGRGKQAWFLHDEHDRLLAMAGLYELWRDDSLPDDDPARWLWTCTVITRPATDALGEIHDRCPVLVPPGLRGRWLDCASGDPGDAQALLDEIGEPHLQPRPVSNAVGNIRNNSPELIDAVDIVEPRGPEDGVLPLDLDADADADADDPADTG